jgi:hypothetical protein
VYRDRDDLSIVLIVRIVFAASLMTRAVWMFE